MRIVTCLCCIVFALSVLGSPANSKTKTDENVVYVNGNWISRVQVEQVADALKQQAMQLKPNLALNASGADYRKGAVAQLIANELLLNEARGRKITFSDEQISKAFVAFKQQIGTERFDQEIKAAGRNESDIRRQLRDSMILDSLVKALIKKSDTVSLSECQTFYKNNDSLFSEPDKVSARQIMVIVPENASATVRETARKKALEIHALLKSGKDFITVAKQNSDDPNAQNGGDLGWFKKGDLLAQIDSAAFSLKINEYSQVVSSPAGFHIILKTDEEKGKTRSFKAVKDQIRISLEFQRRSEMIQKHVEDLKKKAKIEFSDTSYRPDN